MKRFPRKKTVLFATAFTLVLAIHGVAAAPDFPNPVLAFMGPEQVEIGGKQMIRYNYDVANKSKYPDELFAPAPNLPPCGTNTKAARTWVDVYDQRGKKLNAFCGLGKSADLGKIWFALESTAVPPSWVYIELTDRQTNAKYKSNLAETTQ
jgi:hypothetical protein